MMTQMMMMRQQQQQKAAMEQQIREAQGREDALAAAQTRQAQIQAGNAPAPQAAGSGFMSQFINEDEFDQDKLAAAGASLMKAGMSKPAAGQMSPSRIYRPQQQQPITLRGLLG